VPHGTSHQSYGDDTSLKNIIISPPTNSTNPSATLPLVRIARSSNTPVLWRHHK